MCFQSCTEFLEQCLARKEGRTNVNCATQCESGILNEQACKPGDPLLLWESQGVSEEENMFGK